MLNHDPVPILFLASEMFVLTWHRVEKDLRYFFIQDLKVFFFILIFLKPEQPENQMKCFIIEEF